MIPKPLAVALFLMPFSAALADPPTLPRGPSRAECLEMEARIDRALQEGSDAADAELAACGPRVVRLIEERMPGLAQAQAARMTRILGLIEGPTACRALEEQMASGEEAIRREAALALADRDDAPPEVRSFARKALAAMLEKPLPDVPPGLALAEAGP